MTTPNHPSTPRTVVICASLSQQDDIMQATLVEWNNNNRVFGPAANPAIPATEHDRIHREHIYHADEVLVIAKRDGSLGEAVTGELLYAEAHGKPVRYWNGQIRDHFTTVDQ